MKVISIIGYTKTGKTTVTESIIRGLKMRGYSVGSVKEIHYENFKMDKEGTNTDRHRKAGADLVTALGLNETDIMFGQKLSIREILKYYNYDYVILEGVRGENVPTINTISEIDKIEADETTIAISGKIANTQNCINGYQVINILDNADKLIDLIIDKTPPLMPDFDKKCCGVCGYDCREFLKIFLKGGITLDKCVLNHYNIKLSVNGKNIEMVPFIQKILKNNILAIVAELDGYQEEGEIIIQL